MSVQHPLIHLSILTPIHPSVHSTIHSFIRSLACSTHLSFLSYCSSFSFLVSFFTSPSICLVDATVACLQVRGKLPMTRQKCRRNIPSQLGTSSPRFPSLRPQRPAVVTFREDYVELILVTSLLMAAQETDNMKNKCKVQLS